MGWALRRQGGRKDTARGPPGFPPEPQGPPCLSTGVLAASPQPPPLFWVPAAAQQEPRRPSLLATPPTPFPAQSHRKNAILIPQHWGLSKCKGTMPLSECQEKVSGKPWGGGTEGSEETGTGLRWSREDKGAAESRGQRQSAVSSGVGRGCGLGARRRRRQGGGAGAAGEE